MTDIPTREELNLPWRNYKTIITRDGIDNLHPMRVATCESREGCQFILHAVNNFHDMLEVLEEARITLELKAPALDDDVHKSLKQVRTAIVNAKEVKDD